MKIRSLALVNYRRHRATTLEFADGLTTVLGRNGSGKSTILEAIGFALFGVPATRTPKDLIRWDGAAPGDSVTVRLEMELAGQAIRVVRELRGKNLTPSASLEVDDMVQVPPGASSNAAVTSAVEKLLGMPRDIFFTTVVARQKELSRLADQRPADRKRLILDMMGVDSLDRAIAKARRAASDATIRVETLTEALPDAAALKEAASVAKKHVADAKVAVKASEVAVAEAEAVEQARAKAAETAQAEASKAREQLARAVHLREQLKTTAAAIQAAQGRVAQAETAAATVERLSTTAATVPGLRAAVDAAVKLAADEQTRTDLEARRAAISNAIEAMTVDAPNGQLTQARADVQVAAKAVSELEQEATIAKVETRQAKDRLRRMAGLDGDGACPTCEQPLAGHIDGLREHLDQAVEENGLRLTRAEERLGTGRQTLAQATAVVEKFENEARAAEEQRLERTRQMANLASIDERLAALPPRETVPDLAGLRQRLADAEVAASQSAAAQALAGQMAPARDDLTRLQAEQSRQAAQLAELGDVDQQGAVQAAEDAAVAWSAARADVAAGQRGLHEVQRSLAVAEKAAEEGALRLAEHAEAVARLQVARTDARHWKALASGRGHGLLERFKTHLVARIGPAVSSEASRLLARFTDGRYADVLLDDDYQVFVMESGTAYTLDRFSGGEADLVHLALRLAVSRLLAERSGAGELRFLALDEVFGSLDEERRGLVLGALDELGGLYSQILLVTHQEGLRDALDQALLVTEQDGEATVTMHNG